MILQPSPYHTHINCTMHLNRVASNVKKLVVAGKGNAFDISEKRGSEIDTHILALLSNGSLAFVATENPSYRIRILLKAALVVYGLAIF